jgi:hypothetical protein
VGSKQEKIVFGSWVIAILVVAVWSSSASLAVFWATTRHPPISRMALRLGEPELTEFKRSEQKFFLDYGLYVPIDDIMFVGQLPSGGTRYAEALARSCSGIMAGTGIAIWLPLKLKLPLLGERVLEWCWKPPMLRKK